MRDSFIMYRSFYEAISDLPKENKADILDAIFEYSLNDKESELTGISKTIFKLIKPQLLANNKRFKNGSKPKKPKVIDKKDSKDEAKESEIEAKGKQDLSETEAEISKDEANKNVNVNPNENENKNENKNSSKKEEIKGFNLAGQERLDNPIKPHEMTLLTIEETKEKLLQDDSIFEIFARGTKLERKNYEKAVGIFIEHTSKKTKYPRAYNRGTDHSEKHFLNWYVLRDLKEFLIQQPAPIKKLASQMNKEEFEAFKIAEKLEQERDFAQNARDREESEQKAKKKQEREANYLLNKKPMILPWIQTS